jgi:hypothetical protein
MEQSQLDFEALTFLQILVGHGIPMEIGSTIFNRLCLQFTTLCPFSNDGVCLG